MTSRIVRAWCTMSISLHLVHRQTRRICRWTCSTDQLGLSISIVVNRSAIQRFDRSAVNDSKAMSESSRSKPKNTCVEHVSNEWPRGPKRAAIFDFDGTLSLLRRNWQDVMIPMMVRELVPLESGETEEELMALVEEFVMRLNGRQTIYQMIQLREEITKRGGVPRDPLEYKHAYHDLLWNDVSDRIDSIRQGQQTAEYWTVSGSTHLLARLRDAGISLYLASGTDLVFVRNELEVLGLDDFFGQNVYGALDDYHSFSKAQIIRRMIDEICISGQEIIGFGDGFVEIEEVKRVGGLAVGVASDEDKLQTLNHWKRRRLIEAGADLIIGDYKCHQELLSLIGV